jgi:ubiquitin-conjugating enzyme E2 Q
MNGALCMELLTKDGWNPVNDIESVIVSIRSLLVVGDARLEAAYNLSETRYNELLGAPDEKPEAKRPRLTDAPRPLAGGGSYTTSEAEAAYTHLSDYHKKKGWDTSGWWARKG